MSIPTTAQFLVVLRRAFAGVADIIIFFVFMWLLGIASYAATDGLVRQRSSVVSTRDCTGLASARVAPPAWFRPDRVQLCHKHSLGFTTDRAFVFERSDPVTGALSTWTAAADAQGHPARAFYLDWNFLGWMTIVFSLCDTIVGATPAKLLVGLRVRDAVSGRRLALPRALARNALYFGPMALAECVTLLAERTSVLDVESPVLTWVWYAAVAWLVAAMIQVVFAQPDAMIDRLVGARVSGALKSAASGPPATASSGPPA